MPIHNAYVPSSAQTTSPLSAVTVNSGSSMARQANQLLGDEYASLNLSDKVMIDLCQQFALRLGAGIPVIKVLTVLAQTEPNKKLKAYLERCSGYIAEGRSVAEALAQKPTPFAIAQVTMIQAGENGVGLPKVFDRIAVSYENKQMINRTIKGAANYPMVVMGIAMILSLFLLVKVVPKFESMFSDMGAELPILTKVLMKASQLFVSNIFLSGVFVVGSIFMGIAMFKFLRTLPVVQNLLLNLPIVGPFLRSSIRCQFFVVLGQLLGAGIPLVKALLVAEGLHPFKAYKDAVNGMLISIEQGHSLSESMRNDPIFGPRAAQLVETGEASGDLGKILIDSGERLEKDLLFQLKGLTSFFEPVLIVLLSAFIGMMVLALFLPIFQSAQNVG
jgi:type IV pilus assembly protein PilC